MSLCPLAVMEISGFIKSLLVISTGINPWSLSLYNFATAAYVSFNPFRDPRFKIPEIGYIIISGIVLFHSKALSSWWLVFKVLCFVREVYLYLWGNRSSLQSFLLKRRLQISHHLGQSTLSSEFIKIHFMRSVLIFHLNFKVSWN